MKEMIEELYQGLNMGMEAIDHVIDKIEDQKMYDIVLHQRKHYADLKNRTQHLFPDVRDEMKNKMMMEMMVDMKLMHTSDQKIAKMLTEGSQQAVMKVTHLRNQNDLDASVLDCLNDFEDISQRYMEELKEFL